MVSSLAGSKTPKTIPHRRLEIRYAMVTFQVRQAMSVLSTTRVPSVQVGGCHRSGSRKACRGLGRVHGDSCSNFVPGLGWLLDPRRPWQQIYRYKVRESSPHQCSLYMWYMRPIFLQLPSRKVRGLGAKLWSETVGVLKTHQTRHSLCTR
jgi:hypothetical protein